MLQLNLSPATSPHYYLWIKQSLFFISMHDIVTLCVVLIKGGQMFFVVVFFRDYRYSAEI